MFELISKTNRLFDTHVDGVTMHCNTNRLDRTFIRPNFSSNVGLQCLGFAPGLNFREDFLQELPWHSKSGLEFKIFNMYPMTDFIQ